MSLSDFTKWRVIHGIEEWYKVLVIQTWVGVNNWSRIEIWIFLPELWLDSYPTIYQSNLMCGIYFRSSACLSYQVHLYVCTVICTCIAFPFISTLGGGDIKTYFVTVQPNLAFNLSLLGILGFTILIRHGGINLWHISSVHGARQVSIDKLWRHKSEYVHIRDT